jgi:hypothetical protein
MLKRKADLVEMDDGNMIAGLAVHVTFIKLSHIVQGSTPSQTARTALDATWILTELPAGARQWIGDRTQTPPNTATPEMVPFRDYRRDAETRSMSISKIVPPHRYPIKDWAVVCRLVPGSFLPQMQSRGQMIEES